MLDDNPVQASSQMGVNASRGQPLIKENHFIFHKLPYKLFIRSGIWHTWEAHFSNPGLKPVLRWTSIPPKMELVLVVIYIVTLTRLTTLGYDALGLRCLVDGYRMWRRWTFSCSRKENVKCQSSRLICPKRERWGGVRYSWTHLPYTQPVDVPEISTFCQNNYNNNNKT